MLEINAGLPYYTVEMFRPHRYKVLWGGRGAGRSWSIARILLVMAMGKPIRVLCAREMQRSIADSVHRLFQDMIEQLKLPGFTVTQREIRHTSGAVFLFEGLRYNITKIKSMEGIDICWVEEAERVSKESWNILIPTIRKEGSEIWISFNPDQEEDETYQRFVVNPPEDSFVLKVSWEDNPWFPETLRAEKDYLYRVDPDAADWVWGGNTRTISEAQILRGKILVESFEPPVEKNKWRRTWQGPFYGLDFGFANDPLAAVKVWIAPPKNGQPRKGFRMPGRLMIEQEVWKVGVDIHRTPGVLKKAFGSNYGMQLWRADSARPDSISYLKQHGMPRIVPAMKWDGSIEDGIAHLRKFEQIVIHEQCKGARLEGRLYSYKVDPHTEEVLPIVVDKHNNIWDAVRYALAPQIRAGRVPNIGNYSGQTYQNVS